MNWPGSPRVTKPPCFMMLPDFVLMSCLYFSRAYGFFVQCLTVIGPAFNQSLHVVCVQAQESKGFSSAITPEAWHNPVHTCSRLFQTYICFIDVYNTIRYIMCMYICW